MWDLGKSKRKTRGAGTFSIGMQVNWVVVPGRELSNTESRQEKRIAHCPNDHINQLLHDEHLV